MPSVTAVVVAVVAVAVAFFFGVVSKLYNETCKMRRVKSLGFQNALRLSPP